MPCNAEPKGNKLTAGRAKARKATAHGRHPDNPSQSSRSPDTDDESESDEIPHIQQNSEIEDSQSEEEPKSKAHSRSSGRFKRGPWNSPCERDRAHRTASEKGARRALALLSALAPKQRYDQWSSACDTFIAAPPSSTDNFPRPHGLENCKEKGARCVKGERPDFCHHQPKVFLMGSCVYDTAWLKKERARWHPDKFPGREAVGALAQEMFQMFQMLIDSG
jgi:hypothetical protein